MHPPDVNVWEQSGDQGAVVFGDDHHAEKIGTRHVWVAVAIGNTHECVVAVLVYRHSGDARDEANKSIAKNLRDGEKVAASLVLCRTDD